MIKYYFESKSTGNRVEVSESEYRSECRSIIDSYNYNFKQVSHLVFRDNGCDCETTLYIEEEDMPFKERTDV